MLRCKRASCMTEVRRELNPIREPWVFGWCWGYVFCVLVFMLIDLKRLDDLWQGIFLFFDRDEPLCVDAHGIFLSLSNLNPDEPDASVFPSLLHLLFLSHRACRKSCCEQTLSNCGHSLTHPLTRSGMLNGAGCGGELGTEWMLCREKNKINPQSALFPRGSKFSGWCFNSDQLPFVHFVLRLLPQEK